MDILIFSGQSNMQGQSEVLTDAVPVIGAYEYKWLSDQLVPLCNPVGENITYDKTAGEAVTKETNVHAWLEEHVTGAACYGNTNLVPKFCENYRKAAGGEILAVHIAKGSTEIKEWLPGTLGYEMIVEKAAAAVRKAKENHRVDHIYFVWLQGESDAIAGNDKGYYKEKIQLLNHSLKKALGIENFAIIRVGRFTNDDRDMEIIHAQDEVCRENQDFMMLTEIATELNVQAEYMNPFVAGHYSAKGLEKLGEVAGAVLGRCATEMGEMS